MLKGKVRDSREQVQWLIRLLLNMSQQIPPNRKSHRSPPCERCDVCVSKTDQLNSNSIWSRFTSKIVCTWSPTEIMFHNPEFRAIRDLSREKGFYFGIPWDCFLLLQLLVRILKLTSRCEVSREEMGRRSECKHGCRVNWMNEELGHSWRCSNEGFQAALPAARHCGWELQLPFSGQRLHLRAAVVKLRTGSAIGKVLLGSPQEILEISWILTIIVCLFLCVKLFWHYADLTSSNKQHKRRK